MLLFRMLLPPPVIIRSEFIFDVLPTRACHAATISETKSGALVAAWFGGTAESKPDVGIWFSRLEGGQWRKPREVANGNPDGVKRFACYNPVLFQPKKGPLMLFYKVGTGPQTWWGMMKTSVDDGDHWSNPTRLPSGYFGPIKNHPLELPGGQILCPSSSEDHGWRVHFESTTDLGNTWTTSGTLNDPMKIGAIQPSILRIGAFGLRAIGRTQQGAIFAIDSKDLGDTWGAMRLLDLPNPNAGTDAIGLKDGRYLLVFNDSTTHRTPLAVAISADGEHWDRQLTLENAKGEFSYPTVIQTADGLVHVVYTWQRTHIRHVVLDVHQSQSVN